MTADTLIPAWCDTRETFRTKFAAAHDDEDAMYELCRDCQAELGQLDFNGAWGMWWNADLPHLRELALDLEHTLYALAELQQAYRCAAGSVKRGASA